MDEGFQIEKLDREHYRLLPTRRPGVKAAPYNHGLRPVYSFIPKGLVNKASVVAIKLTSAPGRA